MARLWSAWLPDLLPQLPSCPTVLVEHELRRAAQEFFGRTRTFKVMLDPIAVLAAQEIVTVVPDDAEQELVRAEHVWYDGKEIPALTADRLSQDYGDDWPTHTGVPCAYFEDAPGSVRLYPIPTDASVTGLTCRASVRPSETATGVPDEIGTAYRKEITSGAKYLLMMYADKPWTNFDLAAKHGGDFEGAIGKHHALAATGYGKSRVTSRKTWC